MQESNARLLPYLPYLLLLRLDQCQTEAETGTTIETTGDGTIDTAVAVPVGTEGGRGARNGEENDPEAATGLESEARAANGNILRRKPVTLPDDSEFYISSTLFSLRL